jgi:geranylgeranyl pyrophosphate synthase
MNYKLIIIIIYEMRNKQMTIAGLYKRIKEWEKELERCKDKLHDKNLTKKKEKVIKDYMENIERHLKMLNNKLDKEIL